MKKKNLYYRVKEKLTWCLAYTILLAGLGADNVWANPDEKTGTSTGIPQIDTALSTLKTLLFGVISAIGVMILGKNIGDFAQAFQQQDSQGMHMAAKGIAAGLMMAVIGPILTLLGF